MKKKILLIILCGVCLLGVTGCGSSIIESEKIQALKNSTNASIKGGYSLEEVLKEGVSNLKWKEEAEGETEYIVITGVKKDTKDKIEIKYKVYKDSFMLNSYLENGTNRGTNKCLLLYRDLSEKLSKK